MASYWDEDGGDGGNDDDDDGDGDGDGDDGGDGVGDGDGIVRVCVEGVISTSMNWSDAAVFPMEMIILANSRS